MNNVEVFDYIKEKIFSAEWGPGTKLPSEKDLCKMFQISRIKVRENLQKLVALNLVIKKQGSGAYVKEWQPSTSVIEAITPYAALSDIDFREILEYRKGLESISIELFILNAGKADIERLKKAHYKMLEVKDDCDRFAHYDAEFHRIIAEGSGNRLLVKMNELISDLLIYHHRTLNEMLEAMTRAIPEHEGMIEAVEKRNIELGVQYIKQHMDRNIKELEEVEYLLKTDES